MYRQLFFYKKNCNKVVFLRLICLLFVDNGDDDGAGDGDGDDDDSTDIVRIIF